MKLFLVGNFHLLTVISLVVSIQIRGIVMKIIQVRAESRWRYTLECLARNYHEDIFNICGHEVYPVDFIEFLKGSFG